MYTFTVQRYVSAVPQTDNSINPEGVQQNQQEIMGLWERVQGNEQHPIFDLFVDLLHAPRVWWDAVELTGWHHSDGDPGLVPSPPDVKCCFSRHKSTDSSLLKFPIGWVPTLDWWKLLWREINVRGKEALTQSQEYPAVEVCGMKQTACHKWTYPIPGIFHVNSF